jgi:hypothetical protein
MKVNFYYVVKVHQPGTDSIDKTADAIYVAGPFATDANARDYIKNTFSTSYASNVHEVIHINSKVSL